MPEQFFRVWISASYKNDPQYNSNPLSKEDAINLADLMRRFFSENIITIRDAWTNQEVTI